MKAKYIPRIDIQDRNELREELPLRTPYIIYIDPCDTCNLRCKFCYNSQQPKYNKRVFEMLDKLADQGVMQVNLTGGEPLAHPQFFLYTSLVHCTNQSILFNVNDDNA